MVDCPSGKILNPETKRCVNIDGKIGMELAAKKRKHASKSESRSKSPKRASIKRMSNKSVSQKMDASKSTRVSSTSIHSSPIKSKSTSRSIHSSPIKSKSTSKSKSGSSKSKSGSTKSKSSKVEMEKNEKMLKNPKIVKQVVHILDLYKTVDANAKSGATLHFESENKRMAMMYEPAYNDYPFTVSFNMELGDEVFDLSYHIKYTQLLTIHMAICQGKISDVVYMTENKKSELTRTISAAIQQVANDMLKGNGVLSVMYS